MQRSKIKRSEAGVKEATERNLVVLTSGQLEELITALQKTNQYQHQLHMTENSTKSVSMDSSL